MLPRLLALVLLLAAVPAIAQAPEKVTTVEGVTEYRLANGLRVLTVPDPSASTVTVHLTYLVGSRHEGYGEKGMAHLLEHLLFKGTKNHPDIKPALSRRGARYNGTTSQDRTTYFETLPASEDNLDWTLGMEADRMVNSNVRKEDLDSEMTVVRNEFEMGENSAAGVLFQRMQRLAFAFHNYGNPIIGARSDIESVPIERLRAFYRTWYQPDNALLIIGGQFDQQRALELVAKHFGPIPRPARTLPQLYTVEPVQDGEREVTLRRTGDIQIVSAMYRMPAAAHPDYPAVDVLVQALGAAPTGRLHRALVHKGLASSAWAYERMMHDPGYAYFGAVLGRQAPAAPVRDALLATLEKLGEDPIRDEEVERARTGLLASVDKIQVDAGTLVRWLAEFQAVGDWRLLYLYRDRLRAVSTADVRRVAAQYLKPANRVLGAFIPTAQPDRAEIPARPDLGAALAGYKGSAPVDAGEAFDASPENIERRVVRRTLGNGIRIALLPKKSRGANVVAQLSLNWGDEASKTARATACSMASGMLGRGTLKRSRAEIRDTLDRLKASVSAGLEGASIEARRGDLEAALRLAAEMLRQPAFPPAEFEELKRAALTSAESGRGDPAALAAERLSRHLAPYPNGHWFYTPTTEERIENLRQVTVEDARRCHAELVGATGAEFVAVGDFDPEPLARLVERPCLANGRIRAPMLAFPRATSIAPPSRSRWRPRTRPTRSCGRARTSGCATTTPTSRPWCWAIGCWGAIPGRACRPASASRRACPTAPTASSTPASTTRRGASASRRSTLRRTASGSSARCGRKSRARWRPVLPPPSSIRRRRACWRRAASRAHRTARWPRAWPTTCTWGAASPGTWRSSAALPR